MSNSSKSPFSGTPSTSVGGGWLASRSDTADANYVNVLGAKGKASAVGNADGGMVDASGNVALATLKGTASNEIGAVSGQVDVLAATASGHAGWSGDKGGGAAGSLVAYGEHANVTGSLGDASRYGSVSGTLDGKVGFAQLRGQALAGDDGRYQGLALGGVAQATAVDGVAAGSVSAPIDWIPFVPKGWTVTAKGFAEGEVLTAGVAAGGYIMRDRADNRAHIGLFGGLGLGLGALLGAEISFGPAELTPAQAAAAAARAKAEAEAEAAAAAADLIRPMARQGDPIGAHSSSRGWLGMAIGALVAVAAIVCFPVIIGVGLVGAGLMGAALIGLGAVSLITGAAAVGAKLGKLIKTEDGSACSEIKEGSPKTICEGKPVARVKMPNSHGNGKLKTGAKMVLEGNVKLPVSRVKEASTCGAAKVLKGAEKTFVGGPSVSTGDPDEPTAGDPLLDSVIGILDKVSMVTGIAQLPLMAVSALRTGASMALTKIATEAAERATFRQAMTLAAEKGLATAAGREIATQAVVNASATGARVAAGAGIQLAKESALPAAFMVGSHYGQPAVQSGLESMGMSPEAAEAAAQGLFLAGPTAFAAKGGIGTGGKAGITPKAIGENLGAIKGEFTNAGTSMQALREGRVTEGIFGPSKSGGTTTAARAADDVAGTTSRTTGEAPRTTAPEEVVGGAPARRPTDDVAGSPVAAEQQARANEVLETRAPVEPPPRLDEPVPPPAEAPPPADRAPVDVDAHAAKVAEARERYFDATDEAGEAAALADIRSSLAEGVPASVADKIHALPDNELTTVAGHAKEVLGMANHANPEIRDYSGTLLEGLGSYKVNSTDFATAMRNAERLSTMPEAGAVREITNGSGGVGRHFAGEIEGQPVIFKGDRMLDQSMASEGAILDGLGPYGGPQKLGSYRVRDPETGVWRETMAMERVPGADLQSLLYRQKAGDELPFPITDQHVEAISALQSKLAADGKRFGEVNHGDFILTPDGRVVPIDMFVETAGANDRASGLVGPDNVTVADHIGKLRETSRAQYGDAPPKLTETTAATGHEGPGGGTTKSTEGSHDTRAAGAPASAACDTCAAGPAPPGPNAIPRDVAAAVEAPVGARESAWEAPPPAPAQAHPEPYELYAMRREGFGWSPTEGFGAQSRAYGDAMHAGVVDVVGKLRSGELKTAREAMDALAETRRKFAADSNDPDASFFGERRDLDSKYEGGSMTPIRGKYGYAARAAVDNLGVLTPVTAQVDGKPVNLTTIFYRNETPQWFHTMPENIAPMMDHVVEPLFTRAMDPATPLRETVESVGQLHWALGHAMPYGRGSAGVTDALTKAIFTSRGIEVPRWAEGVVPDIEALTSRDMEAFGQNYENLFEAPLRFGSSGP